MTQYYYSDGLEKRGPYSLEELRCKKLSPNTMVWHHPMEKWLPAEQLPELQDLFAFRPPPIEQKLTTERYSEPGNFRRPPRTWLAESILVTLFCCTPLGIVGIVHAAKVESRYNSGDHHGAMRSSREAGRWTSIGFWLGIAVFVIYGILVLFSVIH